MKPATDLAKDAMSYHDYITQHLKSPDLIEIFTRQSLGRARRVALILGGVLVATLILVVFAFVQDVKYKETHKKKSEQEVQFNACVQEAQKQQALAVESRIIAEESAKIAEGQLRACLGR